MKDNFGNGLYLFRFAVVKRITYTTQYTTNQLYIVDVLLGSITIMSQPFEFVMAVGRVSFPTFR